MLSLVEAFLGFFSRIDVFACLRLFAVISRQSRRWQIFCSVGIGWILSGLVESKTSSDDLLTPPNGPDGPDLSEDRNFSVRQLASIVFLLVIMVSGCSVFENSERFYRDHPLTDIYWHEYNDD
jgi:hypothetical protein